MTSTRDIKRRIIDSYRDWVVIGYCYMRFLVMNTRILEEIEQYVPKNGRVLDVGCGFGLFSLYFAICQEGRSLHSFDLNSKRIHQARESAARLGLDERIQFENCDVLDYDFVDQVDAVVVLDLLHHVPTRAVPELIGRFYDATTENGLLIIKEVESKPLYKAVFAWILDKLMDPKTPVNYYSQEEMTRMLEAHGFDVKCHHLRDILPYPHIMYICRKASSDWY